MAERKFDLSSVTLHPEVQFNGVKVFSATLSDERDQLGDRVGDWLAHNRHVSPVEFVVTQSSDAQYHCLAISVFYFEPPPEPVATLRAMP